MAIIRSKIARQLLAEGGAPRKGFDGGTCEGVFCIWPKEADILELDWVDQV